MTKYNIYPVISTNGSQLTRWMVDQLADLGIDFVHLSLPAVTEPLYDGIVGRSGNLPIIQEAITHLKENGFYIRVKAVALPINLSEMGNLLEFCYQLNVDFVHLCPFQLTHVARGGARFLLSPEQLDELDAIAREKISKFGDRMFIARPSAAAKWQNASNIARCGGLKSKAVILPNGDVTHCEVLFDVPEFIVGNIRESSLRQLWHSEKADRLMDIPQFGLSEPCKSCEHLLDCRTGCFSCSLLCSNDPWSIDPRCWKADIVGNPFDAGVEKNGVYQNTYYIRR